MSLPLALRRRARVDLIDAMLWHEDQRAGLGEQLEAAFLVQQLDAGAIAYRKVGTHRRVAFKDLVAYKQAMRSKRLAALEELSALDQELGLR